MKFVIIVAFLIFNTAFAQETKHQVSFGSNINVGLDNSQTGANTDSSLGIKDFALSGNNIAFNYMHLASPQFQIGFYLKHSKDESDIKFDSGAKATSEEQTDVLYILFNYNFNKDLKNSWYIGLALGQEKNKEKSKDASGNKSDSGSTVKGYVLSLGKRYSLEFLGIENLTYSPTISFNKGTVSGDLEDNGIDGITVVTFDLLKVDLLF